MMSSVIWGGWRARKIEFEPYKHPTIDEVKKQVVLDIGQRLTWEDTDLILDRAIHTPGWGIKRAEEVATILRTLLGVMGGAFIGFEVVARRYSMLSGSYLKVIFRIVGVVSFVFMACRYWGAYCYKREVEKQITQVAKDRADFYQRKQHSDLTTQVLHPVEGEYWAEQLDKQFAEWLKTNSQETIASSSEMSREIEAFLKAPPFKNSMNFSKKILDRCVEPSFIVESYEKLAATLEKGKELLTQIERYEEHVMETIIATRPQIQKVTARLRTKYEYKDGELQHYCDLAYRSLMPQEFKKAIEQFKTGKERARIEAQLYAAVQQWKKQLKAYRARTTSGVYIYRCEMIKLDFPDDSTLEQEVFTISVKQWEESALKAQPAKGTQEGYKEYIEAVSAGGKRGWRDLYHLPPRMAING